MKTLQEVGLLKLIRDLLPQTLRFGWFYVVLLISLLPLFFQLYIDAAPPWDFWGSYLSSAHVWWSKGGFFNPTPYFSNLFGGFPAYLDIQSSSWYLPVGFFTVDGAFTARDATILQGLTYVFGTIGVYLLAGKLDVSRKIAAVAAIAFLFNPAFFGNAQHVDIVRAWAILPWLFMSIQSTSWTSPLRIAGYSFVWFQFLVGAYPGNIASTAYILIPWIVFNFLSNRHHLTRYLGRMLMIIVPALLMSLLKWLPYLLASPSRPNNHNSLSTSLSTFATLFYPFNDEIIPNDITMRSIYVVPLLVFAAFFARYTTKTARTLLSTIVLSLFLGSDSPIFFQWQEQLPLLDLSRFRTADFRQGLILPLILLGAFGLDRLIERKRLDGTSKIPTRQTLAAIVALVIAMLIGLLAGLSPANVSFGQIWILTNFIALAIFGVASQTQGERFRKQFNQYSAGALIILTTSSGVAWSVTAPQTWLTNRLDTERALWGASIDQLILEGLGRGELRKRPAMLGPSLPAGAGELVSVNWNKAAFSNDFSFAGYVNLKGQPQFEKLISEAAITNGSPVIKKLASPSTVWETCLQIEDFCDSTSAEIISWAPGQIELSVDTSKATNLTINELYFQGWNARTCVANHCDEKTLSADDSSPFIRFGVPEGASKIELIYRTPFAFLSWFSFFAGAGFWVITLTTMSLKYLTRRIKLEPVNTED